MKHINSKNLLVLLGWLFGRRFAEDNQVKPVLRNGLYHRVGGPGFFWIIPFFEETLPVIKKLHVGNFVLDEVLSKDGIPMRIYLTVLYIFKPTPQSRDATAALVKQGAELFQSIVKDYASQGFRQLASQFDAEELWGSARPRIERDLTRFLTGEIAPLGLTTLPSGGILIKEVFIPEKMKQAILKARQLRVTLQALAPFPDSVLIEQAIRAVFIGNLEDNDPTILMSALNSKEAAESSYVLDIQDLLKQKDRNGSGTPLGSQPAAPGRR